MDLRSRCSDRVRSAGMIVSVYLWSAIACGQSVLYVDDDAPLGGDGLAWETAYCHLQDALAAAQPGSGVEQIHVGQGAQKPDQDEGGDVTPGDRQATFQLINGVALMGGYAGYGAPDPDERDLELYETILSGDLLGDDLPDWINREDNSFHVLTGSGTDQTALLDGFTVAGGYANGEDYSHRRGAGLYNYGGSPAANDCIFGDHWSEQSGGAMYNDEESNPVLTGCSFAGCSADVAGAIYNLDYSSPRLIGCTFSENEARDHSGGAINNYHACDPEFTDCEFVANFALEYGGAAYSGEHSHPTFTNCTFIDNIADNGGAMMIDPESAPVFTDCVFVGNAALTSGGAIWSRGDEYTPTLAGCAFLDNFAALNGGAIYNWESDIALTDCTFEGNMAAIAGGGAMMNRYDSSPTLNGCTFSGNSANYGGAVDQLGGFLSISDCVFTDNRAILRGGALWSNVPFPITACLFERNEADGDGGALLVAGGSIDDCAFLENRADRGGGVYAEPGTVVRRCTFDRNRAEQEGGALFSEGSVSLTGCALTRNLALLGAGIYSSGGGPDLLNCTFSGNVAGAGGGLYDDDGESAIINCTFSGNAVSAVGGAVLVFGDAAPSISNCTFAANEACDGSGVHNLSGSQTTITSSVFWGGHNAPIDGDGTTIVRYSNVEEADPLFIRNPDPGSDGIWGTEDDDYGDLHLQDASPCIDAGDNRGLPPDVNDADGDGKTCELLPIDLGGSPRFTDVPASPDAGCGVPIVVDMGAYEHPAEAVEVVYADVDGDGAVGTADLLALLASWGPCGACCHADFDTSGDVDTADLMNLLAAWGPCRQEANHREGRRW